MTRTIKILGNDRPFEDLARALRALASKVYHHPRQPVVLMFEPKGIVLAIGVGTGYGLKNCQVVSVTSGSQVISGVARTEAELPDITSLVRSETWIYQDPVGHDLYWVYLDRDSRVVEPWTPGESIKVWCTSDGSSYTVGPTGIVREDDLVDRETIDRLLGAQTESITKIIEGVQESLSQDIQDLQKGSDWKDEISKLQGKDDILRGDLSQLEFRIENLTSLSDQYKEVYQWYQSETENSVSIVKITPLTEAPPVPGEVWNVVIEWTWKNLPLEVTGLWANPGSTRLLFGRDLSRSAGSWTKVIEWIPDSVSQAVIEAGFIGKVVKESITVTPEYPVRTVRVDSVIGRTATLKILVTGGDPGESVRITDDHGGSWITSIGTPLEFSPLGNTVTIDDWSKTYIRLTGRSGSGESFEYLMDKDEWTDLTIPITEWTPGDSLVISRSSGDWSGYRVVWNGQTIGIGGPGSDLTVDQIGAGQFVFMIKK